MQQKVNKLSHKVKPLKQITEGEKQQTDVCLIASQIHFKDRYQCFTWWSSFNLNVSRTANN